MSAVALQMDTIWLETRNYSVVALNSHLSIHIPELAKALAKGVPAFADHAREGFYEVELASGWSYLNVHHGTRTVYLVAHSRS